MNDGVYDRGCEGIGWKRLDFDTIDGMKEREWRTKERVNDRLRYEDTIDGRWG